MQTGAHINEQALQNPHNVPTFRARQGRNSLGSASALFFGFMFGIIAGLSTVGFAMLWPRIGTELVSEIDEARPDANDVNVRLLRSVLMTLHDANRTGNYAVLHALASAEFQSVNSVERLAQIFANLREARADLSFVAGTRPFWDQPPYVDKAGILWLKGSFSEVPFATRFTLAFVRSAGDWRLVEIGITRE